VNGLEIKSKTAVRAFRAAVCRYATYKYSVESKAVSEAASGMMILSMTIA